MMKALVGGECSNLPGRNSSPAAAHLKNRSLDPKSAKTVKEISLTGYLGTIHICVSQFPDVDSVLIALQSTVIEASIGVADADC